MIVSRFKYTIADEEIRNHLLLDPIKMALDSMVQKAQQFEDARQSSKSKKILENSGQGGETDKLQSETADLRRQSGSYMGYRSPSQGCQTRGLSYSVGTAGVEGISPLTVP